MNFLGMLKKWAVFVEQKQASLFTYDVNKQKEYIYHFKEPVDDIERAFNQYKCQMKLSGAFISILLNISSFFMTNIYLIKFRTSSSQNALQRSNAVFFPDGKSKNILPLEVIKEYQNVIYENGQSTFCLNNKDTEFIRKIAKRYPFSWYFIFKCMMKIAKYSAVIDKYSPSAIVVCAEYSFTSSALTAYCDMQSIRHINVMHGEKLYYMRDSFFHFHKCYIWDIYYKELFQKLRAEQEQFVVSVPLSIAFRSNFNVEKEYDFTYYLASESKEDLVSINNWLKTLSKRGFKIAVRPHPRYTDFKFAEILFNEFAIEEYQKLTIEISVLKTKKAISLYSTVLNQAFHNDVGVVIDDITNPKKYSKLLELEYVHLNKEHMRLSQLMGGEFISDESNN